MGCPKVLISMAKEFRRYNINQCALYKCKSKQRLIKILQISDEQIYDLESIIKYKSFSIPKKNSLEMRNITAPYEKIKYIQRRILVLLQKVSRPHWLISGEKGKSYITNGEQHIASNYFLTMDIKKFYDNCQREYVYSFFKNSLDMAGDIAKICTDIVTYNNGIPTGCPTSQIIAYYAYQDMFQEINDLSIGYGCKFTLYVDDMTFSSEYSFNVNAIKGKIDIILRKYGHKPKYSKVKYFSKGKPVPITGTIVTKNHELKTPISLQHKIYLNFQYIKSFQNATIKKEDDIKKLIRLKGQIQSVRNIEKDKFPEILRIANTMKV